MRTRLLTIAAIALVFGSAEASGASQVPARVRIVSPDQRLSVTVSVDSTGHAEYVVARSGRVVMAPSALGLIRDDADFTRGLRLLFATKPALVTDRYEILTAKRRLNRYRANRRVLHLASAAGVRLDIVFQVSNDGVAFRYVFPDTSATEHAVREERTSFHMLPETRAWLQPMQVAKTGWGGSNPAYEEYYQKDVPVGSDSPTSAGWVFPALFRSDSTWLLVSETAVLRDYAGTRLRKMSPDGDYMIGFPGDDEVVRGGAAAPRSTLPWTMPWRIIVVGSLRTVAESMLGVDLAAPAKVRTASWIVPGKAAWSWPLLGDPSVNFDTQKRFVDYAADMGWRYCLVDGYWDKQIGDDKLAALVAYAREKRVHLLLWYNSAGAWNTTPQTPRDRMLTHQSRDAEFARLEALGIAGVKVDFFGSDAQSMMNYYQDILEDAAAHKLLVNFHGATLPRGWERTYPNLMTMEAVKGLEFVTFDQRNADEEPRHATMLPFTRNVFDPMDFTPMVLDRIRRIERRTTSAFELALSVVFTSGIQHYAEIPDGMAKAPAYVRDFLRGVPTVWDDVRFLDGYPGRYVVVARRAGTHWYVAGINGDSAARRLTISLRDLPGSNGTLIADGPDGNLSFRQSTIRIPSKRTLDFELPPHGGFVFVLE